MILVVARYRGPNSTKMTATSRGSACPISGASCLAAKIPAAPVADAIAGASDISASLLRVATLSWTLEIS
jgi:hypothetical protein